MDKTKLLNYLADEMYDLPRLATEATSDYKAAVYSGEYYAILKLAMILNLLEELKVMVEQGKQEDER